MSDTRTLYVAWKDPDSRRWFPIGRLDAGAERYRFCYLRGAEQASTSGFRGLMAFPDLKEAYESGELFPVFQNRLLSKSRPDYPEHLDRLDIPLEQDDPIVILGRNGGRRVTDMLELFPLPARDPVGAYRVHFFAHGLRHLPPDSADTVRELQPDAQLLLCRDVQNRVDPDAILLRTAPGYLVGWTPRYLNRDLLDILDRCASDPTVTVVRVNRHPAPLGQRLLCCLVACWPEGFEPFNGDEYQPLVPYEAAIEDDTNRKS